MFTGVSLKQINVKNISFNDLFDLEEIQLLQDEFSNATQVASIITQPDGTPITQPSNFCRLCSDVIRKSKLGNINCCKSDAAIGKLCINGPTIQPCLSGGLWDAGAGISVDGKHIANWLVGQVRDETQSEGAIRQYAFKIGVDEEEAVTAFKEVPSMSRSQFERVATALFTLADQLSQKAYQNLQLRNMLHEREETQAMLQRNEERFRNIFNATGEALLIHDCYGQITEVNEAMLALYNVSKKEALDASITDDLSGSENDFHLLDERWDDAINGGVSRFEWQAKRPHDGYLFPVHVTLRQVIIGGELFILAVIRDLTEVKKAEEKQSQLEEALNQSQKMDAIGQLAGGVAHDFNNMLTGISGAVELLLLSKVDGRQTEFLSLIKNAVTRASDLTRKLLDFSRKGKQLSTPVDLHAIIIDAIAILERSIDKRVTITTDLTAEHTMVVGDPSQLQSGILNICVNSRDAMPDGGEIVISTTNTELDEQDCSIGQQITPGSFIKLSVQDNGTGIPSKILPHIFEPFFTTKDEGKGTGLGLASVYGMVKDHHGEINVYSEHVTGTVFHIYLPISHDDTNRPITDKRAISIEGTGTILIVDDEDIIRTTASLLLGNLGYKVLLAENGEEGVKVYQKESDDIDLVILDMVMPVMNGKEAFTKIKSLAPQAKIIISSGFAKNIDMENIANHKPSGFISKPFNQYELSRLVAEVMAQ